MRRLRDIQNPTRLIAVSACALIGLAGCHKEMARVDVIDGLNTGEMVQVEGRLVSLGSAPVVHLVLRKEGFVDVMIDPGEFGAELSGLSDLPVVIEGEVVVRMDAPAVKVVRYEPARLPTGELPVVGSIKIEGKAVLLVARDGKRFWIRGDFMPVLREYKDAKVWVIGSEGDRAERGPDNATPYWVTGYGVLHEVQ